MYVCMRNDNIWVISQTERSSFILLEYFNRDFFVSLLRFFGTSEAQLRQRELMNFKMVVSSTAVVKAVKFQRAERTSPLFKCPVPLTRNISNFYHP